MSKTNTAVVPERFTVGIDCAPGPLRPTHLLPSVLEGTPFDGEQEPHLMLFGAFQWSFEVPEGTTKRKYNGWVRKIRARLNSLYEDGRIRGALVPQEAK